MTASETAQRNNKSNGLKVFHTPEGHCYVESAEGKICYRVQVNNGTKSCTCGDYTSMSLKDPSFMCKHILAVMNDNGRKVEIVQHKAPKLDERFITRIKAKEFVLYSGLLDLAHQKGLRKIVVEPVQYPTKDNKLEAICKATVQSVDGELFVEIADANPLNVNRMVAEHILRVAATRAKARALRDFTNIGMTCLEELGDLDEASEEDSGRSKTRGRRETRTETTTKQEQPKRGANADGRRDQNNQQGTKEACKTSDPGANASSEKDKKAPDTQDQESEIKPSEAQIKAIEKLAERRGINGGQLMKIFMDKYQKPYEQINASEAKGFIRHLQQAA
ncbi:MAG: SWIM zinc finger domain-containing protein [Smithellaceae bacterium]|nr:SWIM zinc finger domain-containing protein [Smithellaceae bacterium]